MAKENDLATDAEEPLWRRLAPPAFFAALAAAALWADMPLARYFHPDDIWGGDLRRLVTLSEAFAYGGTVALIMIAAALLDPRGWRVVPRLALAAYGGGILADIIKLLVGRHRPAEMDLTKEVWETFITWMPAKHLRATQSFPSAHTATAFGLACGLCFLYPRGKWLFLALAVLAGLQRMHSHSHYLSDVLAGAAVGMLMGVVATSRPLAGRWLDRLEASGKAARQQPAEPTE